MGLGISPAFVSVLLNAPVLHFDELVAFESMKVDLGRGGDELVHCVGLGLCSRGDFDYYSLQQFDLGVICVGVKNPDDVCYESLKIQFKLKLKIGDTHPVQWRILVPAVCLAYLVVVDVAFGDS